MCKPCEIYRRMRDGKGEVYSSKKKKLQMAKHGFATTNLSRNDSLWSWKSTDPRGKKLFQVQLLYFDLRPGQTCHSKVMHRKEVTHSNGSYERKALWQKLANKMGEAKIPMVHS